MKIAKNIVAFLSLCLLWLTVATPASAHTEVGKTSPNEGASVSAGVQKISVDFTDKILNLDNSSEIVITRGTGQVVQVSCIEVLETSLQVEAFLESSDTYKVVWRTVAEDGHPLTGEFSFTATGSGEMGDLVACKDKASEKKPVATNPASESPGKTRSEEIVIFVIGGAVVASSVIFWIVRRKKTKV